MSDENPRSILIKDQQWHRLQAALEQDYCFRVARVPMLRRRELGFDVRSHHSWNNGRYRTDRFLDFYQADQKTMFLLKYGHIISR
jgi:hypothetical protein